MADEKQMAPVVCIHEDRPECLTGVKLGVLSIRRHCPDLPIVLNCPTAPPAFVEWLSSIPHATLASYRDIRDFSWNMKPFLLQRLLQDGYHEVIWVDSDIIACRDIFTPLTRLAPQVFVAAEEMYWGQSQGGTVRTEAWGFTAGRSLPSTVNSGVLRVTREHMGLLASWSAMLRHPKYRLAQSLPWYDRPLHMIGDQEALTALLGSQEYEAVPLHLLRRGADIAQCMGPGGFTPTERLQCLFAARPGLIHSMSIKPWRREITPPQFGFSARSLRRYYDYLHMELTPYVPEAQGYVAILGEDAPWMKPSTMIARLLAIVTSNSILMQEFPLAIVDSLGRRWRRWRKVARYRLDEKFCLKESPLTHQEVPQNS